MNNDKQPHPPQKGGELHLPRNPNDLPQLEPQAGWPKYLINGVLYQCGSDGLMSVVIGTGRCPACGRFTVAQDNRQAAMVCLSDGCAWNEPFRKEKPCSRCAELEREVKRLEELVHAYEFTRCPVNLGDGAKEGK